EAQEVDREDAQVDRDAAASAHGRARAVVPDDEVRLDVELSPRLDIARAHAGDARAFAQEVEDLDAAAELEGGALEHSLAQAVRIGRARLRPGTQQRFLRHEGLHAAPVVDVEALEAAGEFAVELSRREKSGEELRRRRPEELGSRPLRRHEAALEHD